MRHLILSVFVAAAIAAPTSQSVEHDPAFEVASVKANKTDAPGGSLVMPPGRFTATNIPLKVAITNAYQPIYALVKARADDRLGPNLKPSTTDCGPLRAQRAKTIAEAARSRGGRVPILPPPAPNEPVIIDSAERPAEN